MNNSKELVAEIQTELLTLTQLTDKEEVDIAAAAKASVRLAWFAAAVARARSSPDAARHDVTVRLPSEQYDGCDEHERCQGRGD